MNDTAIIQQNRDWNERIPHWFSWAIPLTVAAAIFGIGRIHPPIQKSPAELVQNIQKMIGENNLAGALLQTNELLAIFPTNHIYLRQASRLALQLNEHAKSASYLERFLLYSPDPGEACPDIIRAYWNARNPEKMLDAAVRCANLEPTNSDFKFELALAMERSEKLDLALKLYRSGSKSFPDYGDFTIGHARILLRLGRADEAWREMSAFIEAKPGVADAELIAGLAAERTNQKTLARSIFEQARRHHPDNLEIKNAYNSLLEHQGNK